MKPFQNVLCATDLSPGDDETLRQADALARRHQARLTIFHAMPDLMRSAPLFPHPAARDGAAFVALERKVLEAMGARTLAVTGRERDQVQIELGFGSASTAIVEQAQKQGADLIVVGGAGPAGVARAVLGAVAERVVRHAHCSVWVARASPATGPVVIGTDFSDPALPAVERGADHAARVQAEVILAYALSMPTLMVPATSPEAPAFPVWTEDEIRDLRARASSSLDAALARFQLKGTAVVDDGTPPEVILRQAAQRGAQLICIGTLGRTGVRRMLLGSVAETVVRQAQCSVLVERLHPG
jgi:nucleotide-binding universal stress UspA family protein